MTIGAKCPKCGEHTTRDEVDIGIGTTVGAARCDHCGWGESDEDIVDIVKSLGETPQLVQKEAGGTRGGISLVISLDLPRELTDDEAFCLENEIGHLLDGFGVSGYVLEVPHIYSVCPVCKSIED